MLFYFKKILEYAIVILVYNGCGDCMEKKFIKMNNNLNQLSLGNLIRIIKKNSINKENVNQMDTYYTLKNIIRSFFLLLFLLLMKYICF